MGELWPGGAIELPARFTVDGEVFTVPRIATRELLLWLAADAWDMLVPWSLPPKQRLVLLRRWYDPADRFAYPHVWTINSRLLGRLAGTASAATGDGYYPAVRIAAALVQNWMLFEGWCVRHGFDPLTQPLHRVIAAGYAVLLESCKDDTELTSQQARIWAPPPRRTPTTKAAFSAMEAAMVAGVLAELEAGEFLPGETDADLAPDPGW